MQNRREWLTIFPLFLVIVIDAMGFCLVFPILTPLISNVHSSILPVETSALVRALCYGFALAAYPLAMFFAAPILGDLSDHIGRKKVMLYCLLGTGISYGLAIPGIQLHSIGLFMLSRILAGLFAGSQPIAQAAIADISSPETKTINLSNIILAMTAGIVFGPLIGGLFSNPHIASWFSYSTPFAMAAGLSLFNALILAVFFKETFTHTVRGKIDLYKGFTLFCHGFRVKELRLLAAGFFLTQFAWGLYIQAILWFLAMHYQYSSEKLGFFLVYMGVWFVFSLSFGMRLAKRLLHAETRIFLYFSLLGTLGLLGCALSSTATAQWLFLPLIVAGDALCYTCGIALFSNTADEKTQGWIMGVTGSLAAAAWTITGVVDGGLSYLHGQLPFIVATLCAFLAWFAMRAYQKRVQSSS
jgi:DHA1 family tetracycline resistance protein-like MFS transporter